jgi:hypothetical protein
MIPVGIEHLASCLQDERQQHIIQGKEKRKMSSQFGKRESWNVVVYCNWVEKMQVEIDVKADNEDDAYRFGVTAHKTYCGCNPRPAGLMV